MASVGPHDDTLVEFAANTLVEPGSRTTLWSCCPRSAGCRPGHYYMAAAVVVEGMGLESLVCHREASFSWPSPRSMSRRWLLLRFRGSHDRFASRCTLQTPLHPGLPGYLFRLRQGVHHYSLAVCSKSAEGLRPWIGSTHPTRPVLGSLAWGCCS